MNRANPLLEPVPCQAEAVVVTNPGTGEQALAFTIRHQAGETTVFLGIDQAETWRDLIDVKLAKMTRLVRPGAVPLPFPDTGNGRRPGQAPPL